jgi:2-methylcitrate dehydratase PrpD
MTNLIERFADHVVNLQIEDIPPDAVQMAKWIIFDTLGTGLGGYQRELGQKAVRFGKMRVGAQQATIIGDGAYLSVEDAAFVNGTMGKILGMDDSHRTGSHIASQMVPAALATSETYGTSGRDLIAGMVAAYDLAVRVGTSVRKFQRERGLDIKGTVGAIASAAIACRCAGLDVATTAEALGMAADLASGTEQYVYEGGPCDTKDLIAGFAARNGVFAMLLAQSGFYGPAGGLDGEYGFFRAFGGGYDPADFDDIGQHFSIVETGFKPHGGCRHTHQAVDAVQKLIAEAPIDPAAVERIHLKTYKSAITPSFRVDPDPPSQGVAGLSIRVATSVALVQHSAWPSDYAHWDAPEVQRLRHIMDVELDEEIEANYPMKNGCRLSLKLNSGEERQIYLPNMKGEPEFPMTEAEIIEKFHNLTADLFDRDHTQSIYDMCNQLPELSSVNELMRMVVVQP